jgi:hypothetical protein
MSKSNSLAAAHLPLANSALKQNIYINILHVYLPPAAYFLIGQKVGKKPVDFELAGRLIATVLPRCSYSQNRQIKYFVFQTTGHAPDYNNSASTWQYSESKFPIPNPQ